ncbi:hypothetical protein KFE25_010513 [Diacronema lutheri]|uniref:Uncharacterized protein n=1 Tax=Diacronema lutheri TaxID=2081491 RepID=A0A8J5X9H0_DIALT|nr:hypothetical protein KFE25_010513 [Diacronema lutheri]
MSTAEFPTQTQQHDNVARKSSVALPLTLSSVPAGVDADVHARRQSVLGAVRYRTASVVGPSDDDPQPPFALHDAAARRSSVAAFAPPGLVPIGAGVDAALRRQSVLDGVRHPTASAVADDALSAQCEEPGRNAPEPASSAHAEGREPTVAPAANSVATCALAERALESLARLKGLGSAREMNDTLTKLNLDSVAISPVEVAALALLMRTTSALTTLALGFAALGDAGAEQIARALRINATLRCLFLRGNAIGDDGATALTAALGGSTAPLEVLELGGNVITDRGAAAFGRALGAVDRPCLLAKLELCNNRIGNEGARALCKGLVTNRALNKLNLYRNHIGDAGGLALGEMLAANTALAELHLWVNEIGDTGAIAIAAGVAVNGALRTLWLESNLFGGRAMRALLEAWEAPQPGDGGRPLRARSGLRVS